MVWKNGEAGHCLEILENVEIGDSRGRCSAEIMCHQSQAYRLFGSRAGGPLINS